MVTWNFGAVSYSPELLHSTQLRQPAGVRGGDYHSHPVYHIILYDQGPASILIDGKKWKAEKGALFLISPMQRHQFITHKENGYQYQEITFGAYDSKGSPLVLTFRELLSGLGFESLPSVFYLTDEPYRQLESLLKPMTDYGYQPPREKGEKTGLSIQLSLFLHAMGNLLIRSSFIPQPASGRDESIIRVMHYLSRNYRQKMTLAEMAEVAGCSREHLSRKFKICTGKTITDYLMDIRLEIAERIIRTSSLPLKDICIQVGIEDIFYFSKCFKRKFHLPPRKHRLKYETGGD